MSKKFTLISSEEYNELFPGFLNREQISSNETILKKINETSEYTKVKIEIFYLVFLDEEHCPWEEANYKEITILEDLLENFMDKNYIVVVDNLEFFIEGLNSEIIDTFR